MIISMVMAMDRNRLIGSKGGMPWHLPSEQQYFKKVTMGKPMIMGRKTYDSIGRPLPGRTSIVITRDANWPSGSALDGSALDDSHQEFIKDGRLRVVTSFAAAVTVAREIIDKGQGRDLLNEPEVAVIGGAAICELAMPSCKRLYLTVIDAEFSGDTWLTSFVRDEWALVTETPATIDGYSLSYQVLERQYFPR